MSDPGKPVINPLVVLREEFDDWAIVFDPDSGKAFGLNPTGVLIWKCLDGKHAVEDIERELRVQVEEVPDNLRDDLESFIDILIEQGLAGHEVR
jgi:SynChlorMet cassette protein ScmD